MRPRPRTSQDSALQFFIAAQEYRSAADELLRSRKKPEAVNGWWRPIHFCYSHAIELGLKAFWRSHNLDVKYRHPLAELYDKCRDIGLVIDSDDRTSIGNIVRLLDYGNEDSGFRYFIRVHNFADLEWIQEVATRLLQVVQAHVAETVECGPPNPRIEKFSITLSKPVKQQKSRE
jgi:hypothetical protein